MRVRIRRFVEVTGLMVAFIRSRAPCRGFPRSRRGRLGPLVRSLAASPLPPTSRSLSREFGLLRPSLELLKFLSPCTFGPSQLDLGCGTMASADSCRLNPASRPGLPSQTARRQVSPGKNIDFPRTLAAFTTSPLDLLRASLFLASSPNRHGLICGSCSSSRRFASGFLQTPPHGDALAFG